MSRPVAQIFIIGGSHAGLGTALQILRNIPNTKVTVISTSPDYYWNVASPRFLARPEAIPLDKILMPIEKLFGKYMQYQFEFVHATVIELDTKGKCISTDDGVSRKYDYLVIASGSHTLATIAEPGIPVKYPILDSLRESLPKAQELIARSQRIVIGGGGPVGIELAGEIADAYPSKSITMVFAGFRLLDNLKGSASIEAGKKLHKLGIVVRSGAKVKKVEFNEKSYDYTVTLTDDFSVDADLYIPAIGVIPNNKFIPSFLLSQKGWVKTDEFLAVKSVPCVYAVGDIVDGQVKMLTVVKSHINTVVKNLEVDISGVGVRRPLKLPMLDGMLVPIGKHGGTGQIGSFVTWSWIVSYLKGDFSMSKADAFVS